MRYKDWSSNILFLGLSDEQLQIIDPFVTSKQYNKDEVIMKEGDPGTFMFLIDEGAVSIFKDELKLTNRVAGDFVGLMSLIDQSPRSATVVASENGVKGFIIDKDGFSEIMSEDRNSIVTNLLFNFLRYQQDAIRNTNALSLTETRTNLLQEQKRGRSAIFFIKMLGALLVVMFLLATFKTHIEYLEYDLMPLTLIASFSIWAFIYVRLADMSMHSPGINASKSGPAIREVFGATGSFIMLMFIVKWIMIKFFPGSFGDQLIDTSALTSSMGGPLVLPIVIYIVYAIAQEFIARPCIQSGFLDFLMDKQAKWTAIIATSLIFCAFYIAIDIKLALLTLIPNIMWGYLFHKYQNFTYVALSHVIIGLIAVFLLNLVG